MLIGLLSNQHVTAGIFMRGYYISRIFMAVGGMEIPSYMTVVEFMDGKMLSTYFIFFVYSCLNV